MPGDIAKLKYFLNKKQAKEKHDFLDKANKRAEKQDLVRLRKILHDLEQENIKEVKIKDIRKEQYAALESGLEGDGAYDYILQNKKYQKLIRKIEKINNAKSISYRKIRYLLLMRRSRKFVNQGHYFAGQKTFELLREDYLGALNKSKSWY